MFFLLKTNKLLVAGKDPTVIYISNLQLAPVYRYIIWAIHYVLLNECRQTTVLRFSDRNCGEIYTKQLWKRDDRSSVQIAGLSEAAHLISLERYSWFDCHDQIEGHNKRGPATHIDSIDHRGSVCKHLPWRVTGRSIRWHSTRCQPVKVTRKNTSASEFVHRVSWKMFHYSFWVLWLKYFATVNFAFCIKRQ
jgi:hypothetical protein